MSKTIIVGKSENSFFLKIVKNLTLRKKYKELFVASANSCQELFQKILSSKEEILVVFGTTDKGIHEMLDKKINNVQNFKAWNFFPQQGTETVRLEEAILGCLSIINAFKFNK